jgi:phosphoribosyl 1,2-cyclic phosphodiesterase
MKVVLWGIRGSLASPGVETARYGGNTSCVEVRGDRDTVLVLDAGTGIRRCGAAMPPSVRRVNLLLTHLHMDHIQGLGFFDPLYDPDVDVHVWGPASPTMSLRARLMRYLSPPLFPVHLREMQRLTLHEVPRGVFQVEEFEVIAGLVCHPGATMAYRIASPAGTVAYFPDHEPALGHPTFPGPRDWTSGHALARDVDLLIHDAQYSPAEYPSHVGWGHSSTEHTLAFAQLAGVKHLVTFHHDPSHTDDDVDRLTAEAVAAAHPTFRVTAGAEGDVFELPPARAA